MNKNSNISLVYKILLPILFIFIIISIFYWGFSNFVTQKTNEGWASKYIYKHIEFDKYKTLNPIISELNKVLDIQNNQDIINMAKDESNPEYIKKGLEALEQYRITFQNKSYFAAFKNSKNYYYNNKLNQYRKKALVFKLDENNQSDKWFFQTIKSNEDFNINVDKDVNIKVTKIWINVLIRDIDGTPLGVVGTGFDFNNFIEKSIKNENNNIENYFIDDKLSIQLAQDTSKVDYASFTKDDKERKTVEFLFENKRDIEKIKNSIVKLKNSKSDDIELLWIEQNNTKKLLGITYLKEINWFSLTLIDSNELKVIDNNTLFGTLILTISFVFLIIYLLLKNFIFNPLKSFEKQIKTIKSYEESKEFPVIGTGEIQSLSIQFNNMLNAISNEHEKNKQKEEHIIKQAHLAELGNMFNNIIHQWKQPLNIISVQAGIIKFYNNIDEVDSKEKIEQINEKVDSVITNIKFMDKTVNDFKKYLTTNKNKSYFLISEVIESIHKVLYFRFETFKVSLESDIKDELKIHGYESEFSQVILNILNNALDSINEKDIKDGKIKICASKDDDIIIIKIQDNGNGIPKDLLPNKLFEDKITTKGENGSGIGLHLCKQIIEEHLDGKIKATNLENGAEFEITLPLKKEVIN